MTMACGMLHEGAGRNKMETWVSYQKHLNRFKLTTDRDCLPPDASFVYQYGEWDKDAIAACVALLESQGYLVEVDE